MKILLLLWAISSMWYGLSVRQVRFASRSPIRTGLLKALLVNTAAVVVLTELLSIASLLNEPNLGLAWGALALCFTGWAVFQSRQGGRLSRPSWTGFSSFERQLLAITAVILSLTLLTAILYPPNNFDSLTYHMGRVAHWVQQASIQPYATHIERQLYQPPLAEWFILHTVILSQSDVWANVVQWVSGLGCLIGLSLVAQQIGGSRLVQIATVFMAATIPMVILQLSSTQNDVVGSFYLIVTALYLIRYYQYRGLENIIWAGLGLGFAFLTKGTAYLFGAPLLLAWGLLEVRRLVCFEGRGMAGIRYIYTLILPVGILVSLSLGLNAGHYARNMQVYGHPLTDVHTQEVYVNQKHSGGMMVSNVSRNVALHFGFPGLHWLAQHGVEEMHNWMNIQVTDIETTYPGSKFDLPMLSNNEDNASNFLHFLWLSGSIVWLIRYRKPMNRTPYLILLGVVVATFLLFCAYLKWQPWHTRLHTFLFLLASPLLAVTLAESVKNGHRWPVWLLVASAAGFTLTNPFRPLITLPPLTQPVSFLQGRAPNYYVNGPEFRHVNGDITSLLNSRSSDSLRIGLVLGEDDFDYWWYQQLLPSNRLYHIRVNTPSRSLDTHPAVNYIISMQTWGDSLHYRDRVYWRLQPKGGRVAVFGQRQVY